MEESILKSTKKVLGIPGDYTAFDLDITTHINSVFTILQQLGIGPIDGFSIEDEVAQWEDFDIPSLQKNMVKTYIFLKVQLLFDPPATSYLISAKEKQIAEWEWRLNNARELLIIPPVEV